MEVEQEGRARVGAGGGEVLKEKLRWSPGMREGERGASMLGKWFCRGFNRQWMLCRWEKVVGGRRETDRAKVVPLRDEELPSRSPLDACSPARAIHSCPANPLGSLAATRSPHNDLPTAPPDSCPRSASRTHSFARGGTVRRSVQEGRVTVGGSEESQ